MPAPDDAFTAVPARPPAQEPPVAVLRTGVRWSIALVMASALMYLLLGLTALLILLRGGERIPSEALSAYQIGTIFQFGLFIAGGIVLLVWLSRANRRLRALGREGMQFTPGWSVGWFFVPLANFVMPASVVQDLWRASTSDPSPTGWKASPQSSLVNAWWSLFILGNLISRIGVGISAAGESAGVLVGDALSSFLIVAAATCLVILIRRIEFRIAALEASVSAEGTTLPTPAEPRVFPAIAGAALGIVVGAGWVVLSYQLLGLLGARGLQIALTLLTGLAAGALVGYWTLLGAGGRRSFFALIAGIAAFLTMFKATALASAGYLVYIVKSYDGLRPLLDWFGGLLTDPLIYGAAVVAAGAAVAVTLIRLPIDLWLAGSAPKPKAPVPVVAPMPLPVAPMPVMASPVAEQRAVDAEPTPVQAAPQTEPHMATTPQPLTVEVPTATVEPAQPREPFNLRDFLSRNRVVVIIVGIIALLVACSCCSTAAFLIGRGIIEDEGTAPATTAPVPAVPEEPETPVGAGVPEDTVSALYEAAARGDETAALATWAYPSDLDPNVLAGWGDPEWEIELVTAGQSPGDLLVQVRETNGGFSDWDTVTYTLQEFDTGWLINGWSLGTVQEYWDRAGSAPAPNTGQGSTMDAALVAVSSFLEARMVGDTQRQRDLATARMEAQQPGLFGTGAWEFSNVDSQNVYTEGDAYVVEVSEEWNSGIQYHAYVVVEENGVMLVDEQR